VCTIIMKFIKNRMPQSFSSQICYPRVSHEAGRWKK